MPKGTSSMESDTPEVRLEKAREGLRRSPFRDVIVPKLYHEARLDDFRGKELVKPNRDGLYVTGPAGVGKTHLATAWMADMMPDTVFLQAGTSAPRYPESVWVSVPEVLCELRATFGGKGSEAGVLRRYTGAALLVLDDLGSQKVSDWTVESLYLLLSKRINDCRPTIVTSNLRLNELNRIDSRLASRLGGMAYQELTGEDRRLAPSGEKA